MKRIVLVVVVALGLPLTFASTAGAHTFQPSVSCTQATFNFLRFKDGHSHSVNETVSIDGEQVAEQVASFEGSTGTDSVPITVPIGTHTVALHAQWQTKTGSRTIDQTRLVSGCGAAVCPPSAIAANFNEVAIPAGDKIWFNSSFRLIGGDPSVPITVATHGGQVAFSDGGTDYTVPIPDATITFSPAAAQATITYTGRHWSTVVPAGFGDNVFLAGAAFTVPAAGLPGSIDPVTWTTNIQTDTPGVSVEWQWAAAVFGSIGSRYNKYGVKPLHSSTLDQYPNGDEAGTIENYGATAGARGYGDGDSHGGNTFTASCPDSSS